MASDINEFMRKRKARSATALANGLPDDPANKTFERNFDAQFSIATHIEDIALISINKLCPYSKNPFKQYREEKLNALADSIVRDGLLQPIIVRSIDGKPGWEILSGHNRVEAMRHLGKKDIPAIVRDLTDDQAALVVTITNLVHREGLLPSEKAYAHKLMMEAYKNHLKANNTDDSNVSSTGWTGESSMAYYYIRLTELIPDLLELVDAERIPVKGGVELSYIDQTVQQEILRYMESGGKKLSVKDAEKIRKAYDVGKTVTESTIPDILAKQSRKAKNFTLSGKLLKRYAIPKDADLTEVFCTFLEERFGRAD